ncbi:FecR domain-containing protein [Novosphingobium sp. 1949]|uniref:FecR domain-containing protein n=1 Tax=Novosphingobium organovorum TaxID=2930092 RepID=A0ABT0BBY3_9SPHN|nr:FecR domain-containing protein [Novosphingobium organovorum]MCJ2182554.1 FecR domain-containing protein [Novosphingobium organovorum]
MADSGADTPDMARRVQAAEWLQRLDEGAFTAHEQDAFDAWLALPANADALVAMQGLLQALGAIGEERDVITMRKEALCDFEEPGRQRRRGVRGVWRGRAVPLAIAASLVLAVLGAMTMVSWSAPWGPLWGDTRYATQVGERRAFALDDGSQITLDGNSAVQVAFDRHARSIVLERGRARFTVAKDAARPFTVTAGNRTVLAIGTSFSVEMLGSQVHVRLFEGKVSVLTGRQPDKAALLLARPGHFPLAGVPDMVPGEELVAPAGQPVAPTITHFRVATGDTWESGELVFEDTPLAQAVERVNRYASQPVRLGSGDVAGIRVNGVFQAGDTRAFTDGLTALYPLLVEHTDQGLRIVRRPAP